MNFMFVVGRVYGTKSEFGKYLKMSNFSGGKHVCENQNQEWTKGVETPVEIVRLVPCLLLTVGFWKRTISVISSGSYWARNWEKMETKRNSWNIFSFSFRLWLEQLNGCFFWSTCVILKTGEGRNCPKSTLWNKEGKPWDKEKKRQKKRKIFFGELKSMQLFLLRWINGFAQPKIRLYIFFTDCF